jgi:hypothetical protein
MGRILAQYPYWAEGSAFSLMEAKLRGKTISPWAGVWPWHVLRSRRLRLRP